MHITVINNNLLTVDKIVAVRQKYSAYGSSIKCIGVVKFN